MRRLKKRVYMLGSLLIMLVTYFVFTHTQSFSPLPVYFFPPEDAPYVGSYVEEGFFWGSLVLFVISFVFFLVGMFARPLEKSLLLKIGKSRLVITSSAVRSLAECVLFEDGLLVNSKIKVNIRNKPKKIKCTISGNATTFEDLPQRTLILEEELTRRLTEMLGVSFKKVSLKVRIKAKKEIVHKGDVRVN